MLNLALSEWTKLRSTASFWWTSGLTLAVGALFGAVYGWFNTEAVMEYVTLPLTMGVGMITVAITLIQAVMSVATEYRFGVPATTYRLAPARWKVAVSKLLLSVALAAFLALLAAALAFSLADAIAAHPIGWTTNRILWALPLCAAAVVMFGQGLAWIVRNTAGAIVIALTVQFLAETILRFIPRVGPAVTPYLPFSNLFNFLINSQTGPFTPAQSLGIFAAWAVAVWVIGVALLERRDVS